MTMRAKPQDLCVIGGVPLSREEIIHKYLHLVKYVAGRISVNLPSHVEIDDLINEGILGLIDAISKYDDSRGVKFETYAITRINGAILDALRALDWVPRAVRQKARELERVFVDLENKTRPRARGRGSRQGARAQRSKSTTRCCSKSAARPCSRSKNSCPTKRAMTLRCSTRSRTSGPDPTHVFESTEIKSTLAQAVESLPPQERTVISLYYFEGLTLKEIKSVLEVSESRVSQIHAQAVIRLRSKLKALQMDIGLPRRRSNDQAKVRAQEAANSPIHRLQVIRTIIRRAPPQANFRAHSSVLPLKGAKD